MTYLDSGMKVENENKPAVLLLTRAKFGQICNKVAVNKTNSLRISRMADLK